jgi:Zn-dependent M28 family amino/carboxypeptidase
VPAGTTYNVIAAPRGFDPARPHLIIGAHLDTVPQAPGAEDNASGVAVLLELARLAAPAAPAGSAARTAPPRTAVPVVFIAFGAEEPRGPADDEHHFGSLHYVSRMPPVQRRALTGMVSLDRVGVGPSVRVCTGGRSPSALAQDIRQAAARIRIRSQGCENRTSDHWPFEKAGETVARLGGHPYAAYHSARDRPNVVQRPQLERTGRVMWEFLTA